ncbi:ES1 protein homolog, mitochondrial-like isoform X2 [Pseudomyrmex gracilis]|nr:ES1 protein homolog, mitochondrial-like isoform X2 [Pseudomyrmex gracilis]
MKPEFYAPDIEYPSVDHLAKKPDATCPKRNALVEGARLARTCCKPLCECEACTHGGLLIPGGFGAARTLSNFIEKGAQCTVLPDLQHLIEDFYCEKKPIGSMCIASAIVARVLKGVTVTLGKDSPKERWPHGQFMKRIKEMGAKLEMKDVTEIAVDKDYKVISTPAWLCEQATYAEVHEGIGNLVKMLKKCMNH